MSALATTTTSPATSEWIKGRNAKGQDMWRHADRRKTYEDPEKHTEQLSAIPPLLHMMCMSHFRAMAK
jgi:hypothetical protein